VRALHRSERRRLRGADAHAGTPHRHSRRVRVVPRTRAGRTARARGRHRRLGDLVLQGRTGISDLDPKGSRPSSRQGLARAAPDPQYALRDWRRAILGGHRAPGERRPAGPLSHSGRGREHARSRASRGGDVRQKLLPRRELARPHAVFRARWGRAPRTRARQGAGIVGEKGPSTLSCAETS
jgi:hypothetical protein